MVSDAQLAAAKDICDHVNKVAADGGMSHVWLASGQSLDGVEVARLDGQFAMFGYAVQKHVYRIRADHVVGLSYDSEEMTDHH